VTGPGGEDEDELDALDLTVDELERELAQANCDLDALELKVDKLERDLDELEDEDEDEEEEEDEDE